MVLPFTEKSYAGDFEQVDSPTLDQVLALIAQNPHFIEGNDSRMYITPQFAIKKWSYYRPDIMFKYAEITNALAGHPYTVAGRVFRVNPIVACFDLGAQEECISVSKTIAGMNLNDLDYPGRPDIKALLLGSVTETLTRAANLKPNFIRVELTNTRELPDHTYMITDIGSNDFHLKN